MDQHVTVTQRSADDPEVAALIAVHVAAMDDDHTPAEACHRLALDDLLAPHITMFAAELRTGNGASPTVIGIGAIADHTDETPRWAEVKSMHVAASFRGIGASRRLLRTLEQTASERGASELRLETARHFDAAIGLYRTAGFTECGPFGAYPGHPASLFMSKPVASSRPGAAPDSLPSRA